LRVVAVKAPFGWLFCAGFVNFTSIEALALFGVAENIVGGADFFEARLNLGLTRVQVGV
jgi:hypothetical protein